MPALNPLTGLGGLNPFGGAPVSIPVIAIEQGPIAGPIIQQTVTGSTAVSGPTTFTLTFAASQVGSALVVYVAVNSSAAAALGPTPTGWTLAFSQVTATLALGCYVYYNNPGGITAFTLSGPTATTGGIGAVGYEALNCPFQADVNQSQNGSSTTPASGASQLVPSATNNIVLGAVAWVAGAVTLTPGNTAPATAVQTTTAQITSTNGTTNAAIRGTSYIQVGAAATASTGFITGGTLSGVVVWDAGEIALRSTASDFSIGAQQVDLTRQGPQVIAGGQQAISVGSL